MNLPILLAIAGLAFIMIVAVGFLLAGGKTSQQRAVQRAQAIGATSSRGGGQRMRSQPSNSPETRRKQIVKSLQEQERQQKKARLSLGNKLKQAGLNITVPQFWMAGRLLFPTAALGQVYADQIR